MIQYTLRYIGHTRREKQWNSHPHLYSFVWIEGKPETLEIHFYTQLTQKTKRFFGFFKREFLVTHWLNEQCIFIPRAADETRERWLLRVRKCADEKIIDLEEARGFEREVAQLNAEGGV